VSLSARLRLCAGAGSALLLGVLFLTGCGGGIASPDVFVVQRSGSVPGAALTLVVNDGGTVRCDGGAPLAISDAQLVQARGIQEDLKEAASQHLVLPARPGSVLRYHLRDEDGMVDFGDNSVGQSKAMRELQALVLAVGQGVCGRGV
jgi:hypothetical protein